MNEESKIVIVFVAVDILPAAVNKKLLLKTVAKKDAHYFNA